MNSLLREAEATKFAEERHGTNHKYGYYPYLYHLLHVAGISKEFGFGGDIEIVLSCILHDVIECSDTSYNDIKEKFGERVAEIVYAVTDEKGRNRQERHLKTYPKIKESEDATIVKLCDRIANVRFGVATNNESKKAMYIKEYPSFSQAIFNPYHHKTLHLWSYLDNVYYEATGNKIMRHNSENN